MPWLKLVSVRLLRSQENTIFLAPSAGRIGSTQATKNERFFEFG